MSNVSGMNDLQGNNPVGPKKNWKKPELSILRLEQAEQGLHGHKDNNKTFHFSA